MICTYLVTSKDASAQAWLVNSEHVSLATSHCHIIGLSSQIAILLKFVWYVNRWAKAMIIWCLIIMIVIFKK